MVTNAIAKLAQFGFELTRFTMLNMSKREMTQKRVKLFN